MSATSSRIPRPPFNRAIVLLAVVAVLPVSFSLFLPGTVQALEIVGVMLGAVAFTSSG